MDSSIRSVKFKTYFSVYRTFSACISRRSWVEVGTENVYYEEFRRRILHVIQRTMSDTDVPYGNPFP